MSPKQSDKLDKLYKELFDVQFNGNDPLAEQEVLVRIRRTEKEDDGSFRDDEGEAKMEAYRESVRADGATI